MEVVTARWRWGRMRNVRIDFDREGNVVNHAISKVIKLECN